MSDGRAPRLPGTSASPGVVVAVAAGVLLGLLIGGGLLFLTSLSSPAGTSAAPRPQPSLPAALPSTALPVATPDTATTRAPQRLTVGGMTSFVKVYLLRAAGEPVTGYSLLSPKFRSLSGGLVGYRRFWDDITFATPSRIDANPGVGTVSYDVRYRHRDGSHTYARVTLRLTMIRGEYRLDGSA